MTEVMGTTFLVHGVWYLRYLGGEGSMIQIEASDTVKDSLANGGTVSLTGSVNTDARGCVQCVIATHAVLIGEQ